MNDIVKSKKNFFTNFQNFIIKNYIPIISITVLLFILFISFQFYIYNSNEKLKKNSIVFFKSINQGDEIIENLNNLKNNKDIYSILSTLKLIQNSNASNDYDKSNNLYKQLIISDELNDLYKSAIAVHAAFTLLNATYVENSSNYLEDISIYINTINEDLESYFSLKKELEYLVTVTNIDLNLLDYQNNERAIQLYNEIFNSNLISSSVKERVRKIHEFHIYK